MKAFSTILFMAGIVMSPSVSTVSAQPPPVFGTHSPSRPASQVKIEVHLEGVSAIQLAWRFVHIADAQGLYWKSLAPAINRSIAWELNPREDAHQLIGSVFHSEQVTGKEHFNKHLKFEDYVSNRGWRPGTPQGVFPSLAYPDDYQVPYPSPFIVSEMGMIDPRSKVNGFNEQLLITDGLGFSQGRILFSWVNSGADDTASRSGPVGVNVTVTLYQPWMEEANHPATKPDNYYYSSIQSAAVLHAWEATLGGLAGKLPDWFNADTQDGIARSKGWTITSVIDTGIVHEADSKMWVWWWNHAMGDAPGIDYIRWCPLGHYAIRWLPGFSPADILHSSKIPTDRVVPGIIYPDLQLGDLVQQGGGMMSYPPAMAPIPGHYRTINPMTVIPKSRLPISTGCDSPSLSFGSCTNGRTCRGVSSIAPAGRANFRCTAL